MGVGTGRHPHQRPERPSIREAAVLHPVTVTLPSFGIPTLGSFVPPLRPSSRYPFLRLRVAAAAVELRSGDINEGRWCGRTRARPFRALTFWPDAAEQLQLLQRSQRRSSPYCTMFFLLSPGGGQEMYLQGGQRQVCCSAAISIMSGMAPALNPIRPVESPSPRIRFLQSGCLMSWRGN